MFTLTNNETLKISVNFNGETFSIDLRGFFFERKDWFYVLNTDSYYLFEELWKVKPWNEKELRENPQLKGINEHLAKKQQIAFQEVYHRLLHYVAVIADGRFCFTADKEAVEKVSKIVTETMLKHIPPTCYKLPELPFAQQYKCIPYDKCEK